MLYLILDCLYLKKWLEFKFCFAMKKKKED